MKRKVLIAAILVAALLILALGGYELYRRPTLLRSLSDNSLNDAQTQALRTEVLAKPDAKILVAYFSYSGTTKAVAQAISEKTGGDLFEIAPQEPYSNVYIQPNMELRHGTRPALANTVSNMEAYDIVFVGYPVWWHATPAPVNSFLESCNLSGKLIIPFCTSGSSDIAETMPTFLDSCNGLAVYGEKRIGSTGQLDGWLRDLGLGGKAAPALTEALTEAPAPGGKSLVVYFSWSSAGNTEQMANAIQSGTGADILRLEPAVAYPTDYSECGDVAKQELEENARPGISNLPETLDEYDTVFVGYPIWWHTAPMIIGTFLEHFDLTGKDIYPFSQSASMDAEQFASSVAFVRECAAGADVHSGLFVNASNTEAIRNYLTENGF